MIKHKGLCPSLKKSVVFDVNEVIELKTKRGIKYQVKGNYEGRTCSTFCSKAKAMELKSALGNTTMSAESEDETGQAHQDETVAPMDDHVQPLAQGQEPMEDMPVQETVATPITGTSVGVEAIDNLQLNDADALANMATQFDDAPDMVADFEIAPQEPEGDGRSIGNIRPMNEDIPLHAESEDGTGQAHQEEGVAPIENDVQPLAQGQEPMEDMPVQETVATPITNSSVGVEAIDNLQLNDGDALTNMATQFDEAPEMLADFEISLMQPFGDGQSIGNNTPMNPDVPLHAESFESPIQVINPMDETTLTTPPPVCFVEKIPPVVWETMSVLEQIEYAETGNESLLSCPQCGITKADLRDAGGYCAVSDPEGSEYNSSVDCPYQKHFAPSHWLDEEYVVGHVEGETVEVSERLPARVDMPKMKNPQKGLETMVVPYFVWDKIYTQFNGGITAEPDLSGLNYTLQFHGMMKPKIMNLIKGAEGNHDIMFGSETYTSTVLKAEGDGGYFIDSSTVRPYGAESKKMCIVCNEKPVDYSHPNTLGSLCSTPKCLHYAFSAETFNVEFDDWADQEMLTHGKTVSFKEWAKEEGKKHGDMDLTDWAEHEEESHDERYEAEYVKQGFEIEKEGSQQFGTYYIHKGENKIRLDYDRRTDNGNRPDAKEYPYDYGEQDFRTLQEALNWFDKQIDNGRMFKDFEAETFEAQTKPAYKRFMETLEDVFYNPNSLIYGMGEDKLNYEDVRKLYHIQESAYANIPSFQTSPIKSKSIQENFNNSFTDAELDFDGFRAHRKAIRKYETKNKREDLRTARKGIIDYNGNKYIYEKPIYDDDHESFHFSKLEGEDFEAEQTQYDVMKGKLEGGYEYANYISLHDSYEEAEAVAKRERKKLEKDEGIFIVEESFDDETFEIDTTLLKSISKSSMIESFPDASKDSFGTENFESATTQDNPSLKSIGVLLGVGALATYFAPKSMRDFLNRLK